MINVVPRPPLYPKPEKERLRRGRMTIAIGVPCRYENLKCAIVCADTKITASDWATTWGAKLSLSITRRSSSFAIAYAAEDADAAKMLAEDITKALCDETTTPFNLEVVLKKNMTDWHAAYSGSTPPPIQFVLAAGVKERCDLFLCSPPNTVLRKTKAFAVGSGGRALDPLLVLESESPPTAHAAISRAAYWMYRAKQYEGAFCGGDTHVFMIAEHGGFCLMEDEGIKKIEALGKDIDKLLNECLLKMLDCASEEAQRAFLEKFSMSYLELAAKAVQPELINPRFLDRTKS